MLAVTPDPNANSNGNGHSENCPRDYSWPFKHRLDDMKMFVNKLLVAVSLRQ